MKSIIAVMTTLLLMPMTALAGPSQPERVVELFTSQGCSSCPPANEFVGTLIEDEDTLVLSYGVTYWDYLGWKDTFAKPEFTKRQKLYGRAFDSGNVYTPQIVLNGSAHGPRYTRSDVRSMDLSPSRSAVTLGLSANDYFEFRTDDLKFGPAHVSLVEYVAGPQSVSVNAGENHGRVLELSNVVTDITPIKWTGRTLVQTDVLPQAGKSYALLIHDQNMRIRAASTFRP